MLTQSIPQIHPLAIPDRRKTARVKLVCPLNGRIPALNLSVLMIECGNDGGFSVQSNHHLPIGSVYDFRFTIADHRQISVRARVIHSLQAGSSTPPLFFTGFTSD